MRRALKAAFIGLILAALLMPAGAGAAEPGEAAVMVEVTGAQNFYGASGQARDLVFLENLLRIFALDQPDAVVDRKLTWVQQSDWPLVLKTLFARAVSWARTTRSLGPDELYRVAHEFLTPPNVRKWHFRRIGVSLLRLAKNQGHAQAKREYKEWSRKHKEESRNQAPRSEVELAEIAFRGLGGGPDRVVTENLLRTFALSESDHLVDLNLAWVQQSDWQARFKTLFVRAVSWARKTRQLDPDELDGLSREFRARPKAEKRLFYKVARHLRRLATVKREKKARSRQLVNDPWPARHARLMNKAARGDIFAMTGLARNYQLGEDHEPDPAKSYYWMLRARAAARDTRLSSLTRLIVNEAKDDVSPADQRQAVKWLEAGTVPSR